MEAQGKVRRPPSNGGIESMDVDPPPANDPSPHQGNNNNIEGAMPATLPAGVPDDVKAGERYLMELEGVKTDPTSSTAPQQQKPAAPPVATSGKMVAEQTAPAINGTAAPSLKPPPPAASLGAILPGAVMSTAEPLPTAAHMEVSSAPPGNQQPPAEVPGAAPSMAAGQPNQQQPIDDGGHAHTKEQKEPPVSEHAVPAAKTDPSIEQHSIAKQPPPQHPAEASGANLVHDSAPYHHHHQQQQQHKPPAQHAAQPPPAHAAHATHMAADPAESAGEMPHPRGPPAPAAAQAIPMAAQPQHPPQGHMPHGVASAPHVFAQRELRVEDALMYLDEVKQQFKDRPTIYNEFLTIMKNFKSMELDTPGVIKRVSKLFRGYNNLILGFNTFLPEGFKISLADIERHHHEEEMQARGVAVAAAKPPPQQQAHQQQPRRVSGPGVQQVSPTQEPRHVVQGASAAARPMQPHRATSSQQQQQQARPKPPPPRSQMPSTPPQQQPHQAVEFDHAISYVTKIKKRFVDDPSTYHSFLEILHTYQKEQRGIKEVLEQVAHLFRDHPDLLKEFTFFLPDAVQEQAKERLHRAAAESESRQALQRQQEMQQYHQRAMPGQQVIDMTGPMMGPMDARGRKRLADGQQVPVVQQPESYVYNSAVERQFFDSAREALTSYSRDGGQAWAEFLKCLDLFAQEILSRSEMLNLIEPLLGKRNNNLFEEFKRILAAAGNPPSSGSMQMREDSWYSVPLAEIDFSRCRRCSPSYRALPRDYPDHPCSDRSPEEAQVLNDIWVSLPVGSEESYTFRHMRRNTYEEILFRVEDERFEIDMVIDSNAATLHRLEPIAEEIAMLSRESVVPTDLGVKPPLEGAGLGGKRFQYSFDKNVLGVIHRNSIARIYGDAGQEMLDLLVKNPTVAVPIVVQRLRKKDAEWRAVRDRLNRHWKELAEHNYYKSLDHRSLTWRTTDKRAISSRTLIAEIKDRASNDGREGTDAIRQRLDKAKEEHGSFYEVTAGEKLSMDLDLTFLPKPDRRLFTPHLSLLYENVSWAQRDAYRILAFALERGPIAPADKERCHRLWVEFLGPWFDLSMNWMQRPAVAYQESAAVKTSVVPAAEATSVSDEDEEESTMGEEPDLSGSNVVTEAYKEPETREFTDHHPLPPGAHVSTLYGEGKILEFRRSDHIYAVQLRFGAVGYLRPATVLCSMLPVEKSAYTRQLRAEDRTKLARPTDHLAFGTQSLYLFFRLHQILVHRLNIAKRLAFSVDADQSLKSMVEQMPNVNPRAVGRRRYEAYLSLVYALLDGGVSGAAEGGKYEDRVRSLLGHGSYELATMDKLISHLWKDVAAMANDETMWNLVQLYRRHLAAGSFRPEAFRQEAAYLSDGEPMYAFQHCPVVDKDQSVLYMEYLGVMDDDDDDEEEDVEDTAVEEDMEVESSAPPSEPSTKRPKR